MLPDMTWEDWQRLGEERMVDASYSSEDDANLTEDQVEVVELTVGGHGPAATLTNTVPQSNIIDFNNDVDAWSEHRERVGRRNLIPSSCKSTWAKAHERSGTTGLHIRTLVKGKRLTQAEILMEEHDPICEELWPEHDPAMADWSCVERRYEARKRSCAALIRAREQYSCISSDNSRTTRTWRSVRRGNGRIAEYIGPT